MTDTPGLAELRELIDAIDAKILRLLNDRAELALKVGDVKKRHGRAIYDPKREAQLLEHLHELNTGPLSKEAVEAIFNQILRFTRDLEAASAGR